MTNNEKKETDSSYKESSGTGVLSSIIFAIVVTVILSVVAYFVK